MEFGWIEPQSTRLDVPPAPVAKPREALLRREGAEERMRGVVLCMAGVEEKSLVFYY